MTLRRAVEAALAQAEAAQLREVSDTLLTLSRQLEEERHRADVTEDHACELRSSLLQARLVAKWQFIARREGLPMTQEIANSLTLRFPWLLEPWEEAAALPPNPTGG